MDDQDGTIEIQHFDGTIEEAEPEDWIAMHAEKAEAPDDWSGSVDIDGKEFSDLQHPLIRDWQSEMELADDHNSRIIEID